MVNAISICGEGYEQMTKIIESIQKWTDEKAVCFRYEPEGIVFCAYTRANEKEYPIEPTSVMLTETVKNYLEHRTSEDILAQAGYQPNASGAVVLGWEIFKPQLGGDNQITNYRCNEVFAVRPHWLVYPK